MCTSRCFVGTDASSEIAIWMDVRESRCTCRSGETTDACGGEVVDADELGRCLVSWRGGEMPMRGVM